MKLRELFDKMTPGMLDCDVNAILPVTEGITKIELDLTIEEVRIEEDGSVTLVMDA